MVENFEEFWTQKKNIFPIEPFGNTITIANELFKKYSLYL